MLRPPRCGDLVLYRISAGRSAGQVRPAIVVLVHPNATDINRPTLTLRVFDAGVVDSGSELERGGYSGVLSSVPRHDEPGGWRWPD